MSWESAWELSQTGKVRSRGAYASCGASEGVGPGGGGGAREEPRCSGGGVLKSTGAGPGGR